MNKDKVWYVTGSSQGLGLTLVKQLLIRGYRVAATSRSTDKLRKALGNHDQQLLLSMEVDLTNPAEIHRSVEETVKKFGRIDVVVNNAGYGMEGTVEELDEQKMRDIFEINVFATISTTKYALPFMRRQRSGQFINIASVAGFVGAPGWSVYSATKSAVIAFSEVLALDVQPLGIKVTVVGPSGFRTGFLTKDSLISAESRIADYQVVADTTEKYAAMDGKQEGDPERAAAIFIDLAESPNPPLHLWLGSNAVDRVAGKLETMSKELEQWKEHSVSADFQ